MSEISDKIDIADAWIEWKEQCAIDLCVPEHREALNKIAHKRLNIFHATYQEKLDDSYSSLRHLLQWDENNKRKSYSNAFNLIEDYLYHKEKIKGLPFKNYLFEVIAIRDGGLAKNITGYLLCKTMRSLVKESFRGNSDLAIDKKNDDDNRDMYETIEDKKSMNPAALAGVADLKPIMIKFLEDSNETDKIAFFCSFERIPLRDPDVLKLVPLKGSTFADIPLQKIPLFFNNLLIHSRDVDEVSAAIKLFRTILDDWAATNPKCQKLLKIFSSTGAGDSQRRRKI